MNTLPTLPSIFCADNLPLTYAIECTKAIDQGMTPTDCVDQFMILGDGKALFVLTYSTDLETGDASAKVKSLTSFKPSDLPLIADPFELIGFVYDFLCQAQADFDVEFFGDMFVNGFGECIQLAIDFGVR